jgi:hypothetical protein
MLARRRQTAVMQDTSALQVNSALAQFRKETCRSLVRDMPDVVKDAGLAVVWPG